MRRNNFFLRGMFVFTSMLMVVSSVAPALTPQVLAAREQGPNPSVLEDAEDNSVVRWTRADSDPDPNDVDIENIVDERDAENRVFFLMKMARMTMSLKKEQRYT